MEPATLSLVASPLKDANVAAEDVMFDIEGMDVSLLKSAVILGANASGKSNVIKALDFFKSYIIDSFKNLQAGEEIGVEAFKLNTDDTNILSSGLFRRDQIWFTQKDRFGATSLYSLSDYKVRSDAPFEKDYLSGKYGATPIIGNLESVLRRAE